MAAILQDVGGQFLVGGIVFDQQDAQLRRGAGGTIGRLSSAGSSFASGRRTVKWNVLPRPTSLSTQIRPPIMLHQALADGKPQAGAAEPPGHRGIGLGEGLEEPLQVRGRDADARVADGELQRSRWDGD